MFFVPLSTITNRHGHYTLNHSIFVHSVFEKNLYDRTIDYMEELFPKGKWSMILFVKELGTRYSLCTEPQNTSPYGDLLIYYRDMLLKLYSRDYQQNMWSKSIGFHTQ